MPIGILFWVLMILWAVNVVYWQSEGTREGKFGGFGGNLLLFVLLCLVGWKVFGSVLQ